MERPLSDEAAPRQGDVTDALLDLVRALAAELRPDRAARVEATADSKLDRDLGLDSLGRVELLLRVERTFGVHIPDEAMLEAETPRDIAAAIMAAGPGDVRAWQRYPAPAAAAIDPATAGRQTLTMPTDAQTLTDMLDWHVQAGSERTHVILTDGAGNDQPITYGRLAADAMAAARGLRQRGLDPGERVAIMLPTGAEFFTAFFGILYAGGVPVPIYPPLRMSQVEDHLRRQAAILNNCGAVFLLTVPEARRAGTWLKAKVDSLRAVETVTALQQPAPDFLRWATRDANLAFLQYTSGSTGDPKGVMLTHANLLANIRAMVDVLAPRPDDVFVSWLPLYHDMGLIGAWLGSLYAGVPVVIMSPLSFLARPHHWLRTIHRYRGTLSAAPNFAFELCLRNIDDADLEGIDLSSWRVVANGAEPVAPVTIRRFSERFARYGFRPEAMAPVYGLAECSVGLAFPPLDRPPVIDRVQRTEFSTRGEAAPASPDDETALEFVACGRALPGHEIRIVDADGWALGDRRQGRLQFRGPSTSGGYFENPRATQDLIEDGWLNSGDLAYRVGDDIFITGRSKDIIIRAGRNIHPHEVERAVGEIDGIRKGCVAAFGMRDPHTGTEQLVIVAETRHREGAEQASLRRRIEEVASDILGAPADDVVLLPPHSVPKTSSGKLRRAAARELFQARRLGKRGRGMWQQLLWLAASSLLPLARQRLRAAASAVYAAYWWSVIVFLGLIAWPTVALLPRRRWCWSFLNGTARLALLLTGARLSVDGADRLPDRGGVLASNHASFLDSLVLAAAIPGEKVFAAKQELAASPITGPFLRRLGTLFVNRFDAGASVGSTKQAAALARAGQLLVFFPEGTFTASPGLLGFKLGAFAVAVEAGVPVVPLALRGTRQMLRANQWWPRLSRVAAEMAPPLHPKGTGMTEMLRLRDAARAAILQRCGEPDLGSERAIFSNNRIQRVSADDT